MTSSSKRKTLVLFGLVAIILMIIASSLPQLEFQPGMPLPKLENDQVVVVSTETRQFESIPANEFFVIFFALLVAGSTLYMAYKLLTGVKWKDLITFIWPMSIISLVIGGFLFLILRLPSSDNFAPVELSVPVTEPPVTSSVGTAPPVLLWLVGLGLLITGGLIGFWIVGSVFSRARAIDVVGHEAEKAWQSLKTGLDLKNVIINCYRQMSLALQEEQGIERKEFMTTGEFEDLLTSAGIPYNPVHQLTQLFEAVRYGNWQPNPVDEQRAIHCLEAIVLHSSESEERN